MKKLQLIAVLSICSYLLFKAVQAHGHVELHVDTIEFDHIQEKQKEAQEQLDDFHTIYPDDGSDEYKRLEQDVKDGKTTVA